MNLAIGVGIGVGVILILFGTLILVLRALPTTYFVEESLAPVTNYSLSRFLWFLLRNILGLALIIGGLILVLPVFPLPPGSGLLISMVGLIMGDLPGKRGLLLRIMKIPRVGQSTNWLRRKLGREDFQFKNYEPPIATQARAINEE